MDRSDVPELVDDPVCDHSEMDLRAWRDVERSLLDRWLREDDRAD